MRQRRSPETMERMAHRWLLVMLLATAIGLSTIIVTASPASACSCVGFEEWFPTAAANGEIDAALIGSVTSIPENLETNPTEVTWTMSVDSVHLGRVGPVVHVTTPRQGSACGLEARHASGPIGIALTRDGDHWRSDLCSAGDPAIVRAVGPVLPLDPDAPSGVLMPDPSERQPLLLLAAVGAIAAASLAIVWLQERRRRPS